MNGIEPLNGTNFSQWKEKVMIHLGVLNLDLALRENAPTAPLVSALDYADKKKEYDAKCEKWGHSNRMSLMIIKSSISVGIRGAIPDSEDAKKYLASVEEQFKSSSKTYASTLIMKMITTRYDGSRGIREHIMTMADMAAKLKGMDMAIDDNFLVHFIMTSLPSEFDPFKISYTLRKRNGVSLIS